MAKALTEKFPSFEVQHYTASGNVEEVCTEQDAQALMKDLWSKPEHERPREKLLHLLKSTRSWHTR